jgi:hypothetical protein
LTAKECSAKYQAAKTAGTLGGQTWNEFRKTQCGEPSSEGPNRTFEVISMVQAEVVQALRSAVQPGINFALSLFLGIAVPLL